MAVRVVTRRGERRLVIDIRFHKPDGIRDRYRHDAEVQTMAAARVEERRRLANLAATGSPYDPNEPVVEGSALGQNQAEEPYPVPAITFASVVEGYLQSFLPTLKPSTQFGYSKVIESKLLPVLGTLPVDSIDAAKVREIDAKLCAKKLRPSTRRNVQVVLRSILCRYAIEAGILMEPPRFPKPPKVGEGIMQALTSENLKRLISVSDSHHQIIILLAAHAGLRAGEVRGLRWRDVDLEAGFLVVRQSVCRGVVTAPKSGHDRLVPLTQELKQAISALPKGGRNDVISMSSNRKRWGEHSLLKAFLGACKKANLEGWRYHDLRHFFVTGLFRAGVQARTVQVLAGHSSLVTTQRYAHVVQTDLADAIAKLGQSAGVTIGQQPEIGT